jgi:hypothetical protein
MKRASPALAFFAVLCASLYLFAPLARDPSRFFEWDVPEQYWPDLVYLCGSLHDGDLPYWNPYDRGGYPYYADPQAGAYHPMNWAICAIAGPSPSLAWGTLRVVLGFVLAGCFGLLWLRRLEVSWSAAIVGAIVISTAPFMRHNWELNLTSALAYLPLVLWACDRLASERRAIDGVILAISIALCAWVGSPPALWLTLVLASLYVCFRVGERARGTELLRAGASLSLAGVLVLGFCLVVILPGLELGAHSVQASQRFDSISAEGLEPSRALAIFWPQSGNHLYVGLAALALAIVALVRGSDRAAYFFAPIAILAVLMAMGAHGPIFRWAFDHVPGVSLFRLPHRYEAWLGPAFGALAAFGIDALAKIDARKYARSLRIAGFTALAIGIACFFLRAGGPGLAICALGVISFALAARALDSAPIGAALALLVLLDVTQTLDPLRHTRAAPPPFEGRARLLDRAPGRDRVMDEFAISCRAGTRHRRRDLRGYQDPLLLSSYERVISSLRDHPELAPQLNVRYALQGPHFIHGWNRHFLPPAAELAARLHTRERYRDASGRTVLELLDVMPLAYFVPEEEIERASDRRAALARTIELAPSAIAIVEGIGRHGPRAMRARPSAIARSVRVSRDSLSFEIHAPSRGVVVVNEAFYPGWIARVDDRITPVFRANGFVRAIEMESGRHHVEMTFVPAAGRALRVLLGIAWLAAIAIFSIHRFRSRSVSSSIA